MVFVIGIQLKTYCFPTTCFKNYVYVWLNSHTYTSSFDDFPQVSIYLTYIGQLSLFHYLYIGVENFQQIKYTL